MGDKTGIEWADSTWNPITGCDKVSPGCDRCYAETFAERWRGTEGHYFEHGFDVQLRPDKLALPLRWTKPRRIFVNSMSDLFHDKVPDDYIANVFAVMARATQHTFQVLTKRHGRMRSLLSSDLFRRRMYDYLVSIDYAWIRDKPLSWPLPNVWLGVSAEDQKRADLRIPALLDTPAAVRFVSAEPLLGPIRLDADWLPISCRDCNCDSGCNPPANWRWIDWVIVGGESGHGARPMHPDWARSLRDQCVAAGVPFLFKQWGEWAPAPWYGPDGATHAFTGGLYRDGAGVWVQNFMELGHNPMSGERDRETPPGAQGVRRVGKKRAGRELDGRTWDQYPEETAAQ
ncbi:phage Gp37/Gp68 family protein [Mycobacteroides salmoniphilum]|uniref:DUF5131 family protein n=1 Tax=Mycobacteroides salmoniphilum TaxID=404941 RepID=UPI0035641B2D